MENHFFIDHSLYQKEVGIPKGNNEDYFEQGVEAQFPFCCYWTHDHVPPDVKVSWYWHWHQDVEWVAVINGTIDYFIEDKHVELYPGDGIFVNSGSIHNCETRGEYGYHCLRVAPIFLAPIQSSVYQTCIAPVVNYGSPFVVLRHEVDWQRDLLAHIQDIAQLCRQPGPTERVRLELLLRYCEMWRNLIRDGEEVLHVGRSEREREIQARLHVMMRYVWDHYTEHVTLDGIAAAANISKSSALRSFQTGLQSTPIQYLNAYRLQRAKELLCTTDQPVSNVALSVGFDNIGYFDRMFKRANGITPQKFRKAISTL